MVNLLENVVQFTAIILFLCLIYYYRYFKKMKRERVLTGIENLIFRLTQSAFILCAASVVLLFLDRNFG
ncbi:hypothetical protein RYX45_06465 [Alkalihalophilus pseudofirmus]|uniref:Uncharacterized protein n=1 Tax=Alkalihalophilus pseudofirmus TaxID=79885 RepID=A0AAJ2KU97_ALKPS|nr:hypothetical protein [Alkalihalophilus pseudofirmus]MDV2884814.1 hypothetical protein [Alkalihalophilus pseudofirmus]